MDQLPEVPNGLSINDMVKEINSIISGWTDIYKPVTKGRKDALDACSMTKKSGATVKHALMGFIVAMVSDLNMSIDDVKKAVVIINEPPFVKVEAAEKYLNMFNSIKDWIMAYVDIAPKTQDFIDKITAIPDKVEAIAAGAKDELANSGLNPMELMKVVKGTMNTCSKIKEVCTTLLAQIKAIPLEITSIKDAGAAFNEAVSNGEIITKGKECRDAKLSDPCACYEKAFGPIPEPKGAAKKEGGGDSCCCTTF